MKFTFSALLLANAIAITYARCNIALVSPTNSVVGQFKPKNVGCSTAQLAGLKCKQVSAINNVDGAEDVRQLVCASDADYASDYATLKGKGIFWGAQGKTPKLGNCNGGGPAYKPVTVCGKKVN